MAGFERVQPALAFVAANLDDDVALAKVADHAGLSPFHFQRLFSSVAGETPKQLARRLRLSRGAAMLLVGRESVLDIALSCGFQSHEGFTRAFRQQFGLSPWEYRERGLAGGATAPVALRRLTNPGPPAAAIRRSAGHRAANPRWERSSG